MAAYSEAPDGPDNRSSAHFKPFAATERTAASRGSSNSSNDRLGEGFRALAYEILTCRNPRAAGVGLWGFVLRGGLIGGGRNCLRGSRPAEESALA